MKRRMKPPGKCCKSLLVLLALIPDAGLHIVVTS
jgi:hypothetical protein